MPSPESPDPLSSTLHAWRLQPGRTPEFRAAVWTKIGAAGGAASWPAYLRGNARLVATGLALVLAVGAIAGREQARMRVAAANSQLAQAYVQGLDARSMKMP